MPPDQNPVDLSYHTVLGWEFPAALFAATFLGGLVALVAAALTGGPWAFFLLWLFIVGGMGYGFLYHRAYVVRLSGGVLSWRGCGYQGSQPVSDVDGVALGWGGAGYIWTFRDGSRMTMMAFKNPASLRLQAARFLDEVGRQYPGLSMPGYPGQR